MSSIEKRWLQAARNIFEHLAETMDGKFCVKLWDATLIPLGDNADSSFYISIKGPDVLGSVLRKPTLENILRQYAVGNIDYHGGDLVSFYETLRQRGKRTHNLSSSRLKKRLNKWYLFYQAVPLFFASPKKVAQVSHRYHGDDTGRKAQRDNTSFVRFHYDISNSFYQLFLEPAMQYSCAYFTDWGNELEQAQIDKLDMICRKLRLAAGERFLDIGCGWGGLVCHAALHYGVQAHGVTLSQKQYDFAQEKIKSLGLEKQIKIELRDYYELEGEYDKISSIGMYEHVGIANYPQYFGKVRSLLRDRGLFLNHGITRRAKHDKRQFDKINPGRRFILKYIFPGSELDHIGHSLEVMEACEFEIHDVEAWREHYALTTRHWCRRLEAKREQAIELVGEERYRMWIAYLAGVSFAFLDGSLRIFQTVASKHDKKGPSTLPPTRADLYREKE